MQGDAAGHKVLTRRIRAIHAKIHPRFGQRIGQAIDILIRMQRRRRDAQALCAAGNRRIVDRLNIDVVDFQKAVCRCLAQRPFTSPLAIT